MPVTCCAPQVFAQLAASFAHDLVASSRPGKLAGSTSSKSNHRDGLLGAHTQSGVIGAASSDHVQGAAADDTEDLALLPAASHGQAFGAEEDSVAEVAGQLPCAAKASMEAVPSPNGTARWHPRLT